MSQRSRDGGSGRVSRRYAAMLGVALAAVMVAAAPLASAWGADEPAAPASGVAEPDGAGVEEVLVVVAPGETMWELVLPHAPAGADPHGFLAEVAARNGVDPGELEPGMALRVPQP